MNMLRSSPFLSAMACLTLLMASMAGAAETPPMPDGPTGGSFTVHDGRASDELSEQSRLYLNGRLAATFHLDLAHESDAATIPLPLGRTDLPYTLCGTVTLLRNGHAETRDVHGEGVLHHPDGHYYEAVSTGAFRNFFLMDEDDPAAADHHEGPASACLTSNS